MALCTGQLGVPAVDLPRRTWAVDPSRVHTTRYFMDKLPLALMGEPRQLHLVYLSVDGSPAPFERWLTTHARLLSARPAWTVLVAHPEGADGGPRECFIGDGDTWRLVRASGDLERYFDARRAVEQVAHGTLAVAELQAFRSRGSPSGAGGAGRLEPGHLGDPLAGRGRLVFHPLPHRYDQFGVFAGVV